MGQLGVGMDLANYRHHVVRREGDAEKCMEDPAGLVTLLSKSNASPEDAARLRLLDERWKKKDNIESFVETVMASPASRRLAAPIGKHPYVPEAFIMNAQGTIIGETNRTSTYWKGEQEKFTGAYAGETGAIWYGTLEFDESTSTNSVQISVPVVKAGKAIGGGRNECPDSTVWESGSG
jgi:hypothetical protein